MEAATVLNTVEFRHKNKLHEYSQRSSIALPVYQTVNEGSQHIPEFRSSVDVDGMRFVSPSVFIRRKEAEHYVAKFALESILNKIRQDGITLLNNDTAFCTSILHEYAAKMQLELPTYTTSKSEGPLPLFITTVVFNGKTFSGDVGRNKTDAKRLGARTVIQWILGQSETSIVMAEIIKSKAKLFNVFHRSSSSVVPQDNNVHLEVSGETIAKEKIMHTESTNCNLPAEVSVLPAAENHKEQHVCGVCSGTLGENNTVPTNQNNNQAEGPTIGPVNSVSNNSCPDSVIQVKEEVPSENPQMLPANLQTPNLSSSGKRRRKKNRKGSALKKMRTSEYLQGSNPQDAEGKSDPQGSNPQDAEGKSDPQGSNPQDAEGKSDPQGSNPQDAEGKSDPQGSNPQDAEGKSDPQGAEGKSDPHGSNPQDAEGKSDPQAAEGKSDLQGSNPQDAEGKSDPKASNPQDAEWKSDPQCAEGKSDPQGSSQQDAEGKSDPPGSNPQDAEGKSDPHI